MSEPLSPELAGQILVAANRAWDDIKILGLLSREECIAAMSPILRAFAREIKEVAQKDTRREWKRAEGWKADCLASQESCRLLAVDRDRMAENWDEAHLRAVTAEMACKALAEALEKISVYAATSGGGFFARQVIALAEDAIARDRSSEAGRGKP